MANLMAASNQWASRPADQRCWNRDEREHAVRAHREAARTKPALPSTLRVEANGDELTIFGKSDIPATMSHWAFSQLATKFGAPAGYLRTLAPTLAAQNINYGIKKNADDRNGNLSLLFHQNGGYYLRALLTERYTRLWNETIVSRLKELVSLDSSWRVPPARPSGVDGERIRIATEADVLQVRNSGLAIRKLVRLLSES